MQKNDCTIVLVQFFWEVNILLKLCIGRRGGCGCKIFEMGGSPLETSKYTLDIGPRDRKICQKYPFKIPLYPPMGLFSANVYAVLK